MAPLTSHPCRLGNEKLHSSSSVLISSFFVAQPIVRLLATLVSTFFAAISSSRQFRIGIVLVRRDVFFAIQVKIVNSEVSVLDINDYLYRPSKCVFESGVVTQSPSRDACPTLLSSWPFPYLS